VTKAIVALSLWTDRHYESGTVKPTLNALNLYERNQIDR
jgi:hypothetical protein